MRYIKKIIIYNLNILGLSILFLHNFCDFNQQSDKNLEELRILIHKEEVDYQKLVKSKEETEKLMNDSKTKDLQKLGIEEILSGIEIDKINSLLGTNLKSFDELKNEILKLKEQKEQIATLLNSEEEHSNKEIDIKTIKVIKEELDSFIDEKGSFLELFTKQYETLQKEIGGDKNSLSDPEIFYYKYVKKLK